MELARERKHHLSVVARRPAASLTTRDVAEITARARRSLSEALDDLRPGSPVNLVDLLVCAYDAAILAWSESADAVRPTAAELLGVLRPAVTAAHLGALAAVGMEEHPAWPRRIRQSNCELAAFTSETVRAVGPVPEADAPLTTALVRMTVQVLSWRRSWHADLPSTVGRIRA